MLQNAAVEVKDGKIEEIYESETQMEELKDKVTDLGRRYLDAGDDRLPQPSCSLILV